MDVIPSNVNGNQLLIESETNFQQNFESKLIEYDEQHQGSQKRPWTKDKIFEVIENVRQSRVICIDSKSRRTPMDYYWNSKYDVMTIGNQEHLIFKKKSADGPTVLIIPREEYFRVLQDAHKACGHGGRDKILNEIKSRIYIPKKAVEIFVALCPTCKNNKKPGSRKAPVPDPIVRQNNNVICEVELLELQSYSSDMDDLERLCTKTDDGDSDDENGKQQSEDSDNGDDKSGRSGRSANFTAPEIALLLRCVRPEANIVFDKRTNSTIIDLKKKAWDRIAKEYNKQSPSHRSAKVLQIKVSNMKRRCAKIRGRWRTTDRVPLVGQSIKSQPHIKTEPEQERPDDTMCSDGELSPDETERTVPQTAVPDPLATVLQSDVGMNTMASEAEEVTKLKIELLQYQMETAKMERKRLEDAINSQAIESAMRLRSARLEAVAAASKLTPNHPALIFTPEESVARNYLESD